MIVQNPNFETTAQFSGETLQPAAALLGHNASRAALSFYEFFAGGGLARAGLGEGWSCHLAHESDAKKAASYAANFGSTELQSGEIADIAVDDLQGPVDLAWASLPFVPGHYDAFGDAGWSFFEKLQQLCESGRAPRLIALENVPGILTAHGGRAFAHLCAALEELGYMFGAVVLDAEAWMPQSRARLFMIALRKDCPMPSALMRHTPPEAWLHHNGVAKAYAALPDRLKAGWVWWNLPAPVAREINLVDIIETDPTVPWHSEVETEALLATMNEVNLAKVHAAQAAGGLQVGALYKRTRVEGGEKFVRAEVRFDGVAGCLRPPKGGSSRQTLIIVENGVVRSRLLSPREAARLMGLSESYHLPARQNEAYWICGEGVAVPAVRYLAEHLFEPLALAARDVMVELQPKSFPN